MMIKIIWKNSPDTAAMIVLSLLTMLLAFGSVIFSYAGMPMAQHTIGLFIVTGNVYIMFLLARQWHRTDSDLKKRQAKEMLTTPEEREKIAEELSTLTGIPKKQFMVSVRKRRRDMTLLTIGGIVANAISLTSQLIVI